MEESEKTLIEVLKDLIKRVEDSHEETKVFIDKRKEEIEKNVSEKYELIHMSAEECNTLIKRVEELSMLEESMKQMERLLKEVSANLIDLTRTIKGHDGYRGMLAIQQEHGVQLDNLTTEMNHITRVVHPWMKSLLVDGDGVNPGIASLLKKLIEEFELLKKDKEHKDWLWNKFWAIISNWRIWIGFIITLSGSFFIVKLIRHIKNTLF